SGVWLHGFAGEREDHFELTERRRSGYIETAAQQEDMPDDLRLLLDAIAVERLAGFESVAGTAEGMAHQQQVAASAGLRLPDMGHLMQEQGLQTGPFGAVILAPQPAFGVGVDVAHRRDQYVPGLEREEGAAADRHPFAVDGIAEHLRDE